MDRPRQDQDRLRDSLHQAVLRLHATSPRRRNSRRDRRARSPDPALDEGACYMTKAAWATSRWPLAPVGSMARLENGYLFDSEVFSGEGDVPLVRIRDLTAET